MKNRGGKHGARMPLADALDQVIKSANTAKATYAPRQPMFVMRTAVAGVKINVPIPVPANVKPIAKPRWRTNQRATTLACGPNPKIVIPKPNSKINGW